MPRTFFSPGLALVSALLCVVAEGQLTNDHREDAQPGVSLEVLAGSEFTLPPSASDVSLFDVRFAVQCKPPTP